MDEFSIGDLARQTGTKAPTIRYYEQIGLMPETRRTAGNQRRYDRWHVARLIFIKHGRELGFPLSAVRALLGLAEHPNQSCAAVDRIARAQLREVETRISRLAVLKAELERMVVQCRQGTIANCRIIEVLADHGGSITEHRST